MPLYFKADFGISVGSDWMDYERRLDARIKEHVRSILDKHGFSDIAVFPASSNYTWAVREQATYYKALIRGSKRRLEDAKMMLALHGVLLRRPEPAR